MGLLTTAQLFSILMIAIGGWFIYWGRPLGATESIAVDVRIVAATNRELSAEVRAGRFRSDLFYRLRVVSIELPPLRERREDIVPLALHFLNSIPGGSKVTGLAPEAVEPLVSHPWEGNVRELENVIEAAVAFARGPLLTPADLGLESADLAVPRAETPTGLPVSLAAYERRCLEEALARVDGDVRRAAELLGLGRSTLYRKLARHGLHPHEV